MKRFSRLCFAVAVAMLTSVSRGGPNGFYLMSDLLDGIGYSEGRGISGDGNVSVGYSSSSIGSIEGFRYLTGGGMTGVGSLGGSPQSDANGACWDGSVVVGTTSSSMGDQAYRWSQSGGMVGLGDLAGGRFASIANGVSSDGAVVVGVGSVTGTFPNGFNEAFRWTAASGMVSLGDLPGGDTYSAADGVSADGSTVVGFGVSANGGEAFRWTASGGMIGLGRLGGFGGSRARAASADGSVIVGVSDEATGGEAFRWTIDGMVGLGYITGFNGSSDANGVSADGSVIVGMSSNFSPYGDGAFIWDAQRGMRELEVVLTHDLGMDLQGWHLDNAYGVSADGRVITGTASAPGGRLRGWVAVIPEPSILPTTAIVFLLARRSRARR
jgi:probable HAF family extracellular repeat protein